MCVDVDVCLAMCVWMCMSVWLCVYINVRFSAIYSSAQSAFVKTSLMPCMPVFNIRICLLVHRSVCVAKTRSKSGIEWSRLWTCLATGSSFLLP